MYGLAFWSSTYGMAFNNKWATDPMDVSVDLSFLLRDETGFDTVKEKPGCTLNNYIAFNVMPGGGRGRAEERGKWLPTADCNCISHHQSSYRSTWQHFSPTQYQKFACHYRAQAKPPILQPNSQMITYQELNLFVKTCDERRQRRVIPGNLVVTHWISEVAEEIKWNKSTVMVDSGGRGESRNGW